MKIRFYSYTFGLIGSLLPVAILASETSAVGTTNQDYLRMALTLAFVIGLIFACAWLLRRMSGGSRIHQKHFKVISVYPLGARERLMIVKVVDDYLLLGITAHSISQLHQFKAPIEAHEFHPASPFANKLINLLKGANHDSLASPKTAEHSSDNKP